MNMIPKCPSNEYECYVTSKSKMTFANAHLYHAYFDIPTYNMLFSLLALNGGLTYLKDIFEW